MVQTFYLLGYETLIFSFLAFDRRFCNPIAIKQITHNTFNHNSPRSSHLCITLPNNLRDSRHNHLLAGFQRRIQAASAIGGGELKMSCGVR